MGKVIGRAAGVALLAVGALLIYWGYQSDHALASTFTKAFTGAPTDATRNDYLGGIVCAVLGAFLAVFGLPGGRKR